MKYNIPVIGKLLVCAAVMFSFTACNDDAIDDTALIEFGISANTFTVSANAGHVDLQLLSNRNCRLDFIEDTPWAEISIRDVNGDAKFYIDYDDNPSFPRIAKVIVSAQGTALADTIVLRQRGMMTPEVKIASGSLVLDGSRPGYGQEGMETNLDFDTDVIPEVVYTGGEGSGWIESVTRDADGNLSLKYAANQSDNPRSATLNLTFDNGWGEMQATTLFLTQKNRNDELGRNVSFEDIIGMARMSADVTIDDYYIITGYVVSNRESRNAGDNIQSTPTSIDYTICDRTVYLESEDGRYGFNVLTATADDNVFDRYDRVQLLLKGAVLHGENDPDRYELSGITTSMIVGRTAGTAADIPVKEKYISELTDDDMYTYVTLKDCEFPVRQGSLTPIHDGYTLADNAHRMTKYPRLMRDIQGSSIYLYTNTTCPYRRDGRRLPYGSGKISGVVVFEYFKAYVYGDGYDTDTHGRIGTYQLRHQSYDDIQFDAEQSFSNLLTEYRYIKDKAKETDGLTYWYPTYGKTAVLPIPPHVMPDAMDVQHGTISDGLALPRVLRLSATMWATTAPVSVSYLRTAPTTMPTRKFSIPTERDRAPIPTAMHGATCTGGKRRQMKARRIPRIHGLSNSQRQESLPTVCRCRYQCRADVLSSWWARYFGKPNGRRSGILPMHQSGRR